MADQKPHTLGDVVLVHDPNLAEQIGRTGQVGVIINARRGDARVLFLPDRGTYWVDDHRLYPHPDPAEVAPPGLLQLSAALRVLDPEEAELDTVDESGTLHLHALCLRFDDETPRRLRQLLEDSLLGWEVVPYGMALVTVVLRIEAAP